jgi:hypothetical protein
LFELLGGFGMWNNINTMSGLIQFMDIYPLVL